MILIDANLLVYAVSPSLPQHAAASAWLDARLNGAARVGLPWPSILAFLRLVTNPRLFSPPVAFADAWKQVEEWLERPCVWIPTPTEDHPVALAPLIRQCTDSRLIPDAHLAAIAIEHGLTLVSTDGDFARFKGLRWENPLAE